MVHLSSQDIQGEDYYDLLTPTKTLSALGDDGDMKSGVDEDWRRQQLQRSDRDGY